MTKKTKKYFCPECQGIIKPGRTKLVYRLTDMKITVNNMRANICSQCGQAFISGRAAEELNRLVNRVSEDVTRFLKTQPGIRQNHNEVIQTRVVSVGLVNKTQVHPRKVFADPITDRASAVIVAHNHPAGGTSPSQEDREVTQQLKSAGETLGIRLLDHIIFDRKDYYSFLEKGEI